MGCVSRTPKGGDDGGRLGLAFGDFSALASIYPPGVDSTRDAVPLSRFLAARPRLQGRGRQAHLTVVSPSVHVRADARVPPVGPERGVCARRTAASAARLWIDARGNTDGPRIRAAGTRASTGRAGEVPAVLVAPCGTVELALFLSSSHAASHPELATGSGWISNFPAGPGCFVSWNPRCLASLRERLGRVSWPGRFFLVERRPQGAANGSWGR